MIQRFHVLIVDDNPAIHTDIRKVLSGRSDEDQAFSEAKARLFGRDLPRPEKVRFDIDSAYQGQEGLQKVEAAIEQGDPYALAFVDVRMPPGWDGVETISRLWEKCPDLQVVICTAYSDYSWEEMTTKLGNSDRLVVLKKPFDNIEVLQLAYALTKKWVQLQLLNRQLEDLDRLVQERSQELQESRALLEAVVENVPLMVFLKEPEDLRFVLFNRAGEELLGVSRESILGKNILDMFPPDQAAHFMADDRRVLEGELGLLDIPEEPILTSLKGERLLHTRKVCLRGPDGKTKYLLGISEDITERKQVERALKESEGRFRALAQNSWDITSILDAEGRLVYNSPACEPILGFTPEELLGRSIVDLMHPEDAPQVARAMEWVLEHPGLPASVEYRLVHKDGHLVWMEAVCMNQLDNPAIQGVVANTRDISVRKKAEAENARLQAQVHHSQKLDSLGSLAGGVAHDFNNMLSGILGYANLLAMNETDPVRRKYIVGIEKAAQRSAELTQKLLAFGRRGKNLVEAVNLRLAAEECLGLLKPSMHANLTVRSDFQEPCWVDGDPNQIQQILVNLCLNAMEAMPGGGTLKLSCRPCVIGPEDALRYQLPEGSYVELQVADVGVGMNDEVRERIFEPFFTTKAHGPSPGTGLGLSTVFGIVVTHHGAISVESEPGQGSTFQVLLPSGSMREGPAQKGPAADNGKGRGKVLVVEDEHLLRELAEEALKTLGYTVCAAENGKEGVAAFRLHHGDLQAVILDLKMPVMGGTEAFSQMHQIDPSVPVIVCTGYGENEEVQRLISQGAAAMLSKPYQVSELSDAIARHAKNTGPSSPSST
jgi:PAS domain S-box-containing protein